MSESVEALAEKVRGCLNDREGMTFSGARRALDALLARLANYERYVEREIEPKLLARLAEAEKERDIAREQAANHLARLLAERKAAEADRDHLREELRIREESQIPVIPRVAQERLEVAEAERDRYRDALERLRLAVNGIIPALDQNEVVNERDRARLLTASYAADAILNPEQP